MLLFVFTFLLLLLVAARLLAASWLRTGHQSSLAKVPINQSGTEKGGGDSAREMMVVLGSGGHTSEMLTILEALLNDNRAKRISTLHLVVAETDQGSVARAKKLLEGRQLEVEWHMIPRSREVGQRIRKIAEEYKRFIVDYLSPHSATTVRQSSGLAWIESTQALSDAHEGFGMSVDTALVELPPVIVGFEAADASKKLLEPYFTTIFTTLASIWACLSIVWRSPPSLLLVNGPGTCVPVVAAVILLEALALIPGRCSIVYVESICRVTTLSLTGSLFYYLGLCDLLVVQWEVLARRMPTESTKVDAKSDSAELGPGSGTGSAIPRPDKEVVYQGVKIGTIRASDGCVEVTDIGAALNRLTEHFGVDDLEGLLGCLDDNDPLRELRDEFLFPQSLCGDAGDNNKVIYFLGNSLGLMPAPRERTREQRADQVGRPCHRGTLQRRPAVDADGPAMSAIVGAASIDEVALMNSVTVNLHLLLVSHRVETSARSEVDASPAITTRVGKASRSSPSGNSLVCLVVSQLELHGFTREEALIELCPREGEYTLRTDDILAEIDRNKESLAVVCLSGVQYYSGQYFNIPLITAATRKAGAFSLWDLAHAAGNVDLALHQWGVDGAVWCTYKYINSGAGGIGGLFLHQRHHHRNSGPDQQPYLKGWWGHLESTRFEMTNEWEPEVGAAAMRLSNVSMLAGAAMMGSLEVFSKTSMTQLRTKSILLTGLLERELRRLARPSDDEATEIFKIITPEDPCQRGAQLSLRFQAVPPGAAEENVTAFTLRVHRQLEARGVITDYRNPNLIRVAPAPLYCRFADVGDFICRLQSALFDL
ncbi:hypothetical protein FOZ60_013520 [Perkinsus olseni]|uniref:Kynureninase n=1 Tax=Perkinsus olseni TaxID=32597 RepID=A0A7J6P967_PEROL|nr:hypothetical protein FOZ60_013520 [Perkinsus olseni]